MLRVAGPRNPQKSPHATSESENGLGPLSARHQLILCCHVLPARTAPGLPAQNEKHEDYQPDTKLLRKQFPENYF